VELTPANNGTAAGAARARTAAVPGEQKLTRDAILAAAALVLAAPYEPRDVGRVTLLPDRVVVDHWVRSGSGLVLVTTTRRVAS